MITSSILDLFEYIKTENFKSLINYVQTKYYDKLKNF